jgi:hypothetical protein
VGHLVENDVNTLHEERIHLVGTNYIGYIDLCWIIFKKKKSNYVGV